MITLEEAIQQNRDLAASNREIYEETGHVCEHSLKAAEYFDQLASWLEELKVFRRLKSVVIPDIMRAATDEEIEAVENYIKSISVPTGVNFNDF